MGPRTRMHDRSCGIDNSECLHSYICRQVDCGTFEFGGKIPGFNTVKDLWGKLMLSFLFAGKFPCHSAWFLGRNISCRRRGWFIFYKQNSKTETLSTLVCNAGTQETCWIAGGTRRSIPFAAHCPEIGSFSNSASRYYPVKIRVMLEHEHGHFCNDTSTVPYVL